MPAGAEQKKLKVCNLVEYKDGYVIKAIETDKSDTIIIISARSCLINKHSYKKLQVGNIYNFIIDDRIKNISAIPIQNFVVRIKKTVVWKSGDDISKIPVFSLNCKGIWIKE